MKTTKVHQRRMIRADMPEILEIERSCFEFPWEENDFLCFLRQRNTIGLVAELGGQVVGYVLYELHPDHLVIVNLAVDYEYQREGVGWQMIERLKGKLSFTKRRFVLTDVCERNLNAHKFLAYCGFRAVGVLPGYFEDNSDAYRFRYSPTSSVIKNRLAEYL